MPSNNHPSIHQAFRQWCRLDLFSRLLPVLLAGLVQYCCEISTRCSAAAGSFSIGLVDVFKNIFE